MSERNKNHRYTAYGLNIESAFRLSDLIESDAAGDAFFKKGKIDEDLISKEFPGLCFYRTPGYTIGVSADVVYFHWEKTGKALVSCGSEALVETDAGVEDKDIQPFLTGPVMGVLLHQRENFVLHSSAVSINGSAVAFLGDKGYGKSTLAAHLHVRGHRLISDDLVPVKFDRANAWTSPGYPKIKLHEDSIKAVGSKPDRFPLIHSFMSKRSFQHGENFSTDPIRLGCLFILGLGEDVVIDELSSMQAFAGLAKNTYLHKYLDPLDYQPKHLEQVGQLIEKVPVLGLIRPPRFDAMNKVIRLLENYTSGTSRSLPIRIAARI